MKIQDTQSCEMKIDDLKMRYLGLVKNTNASTNSDD